MLPDISTEDLCAELCRRLRDNQPEASYVAYSPFAVWPDPVVDVLEEILAPVKIGETGNQSIIVRQSVIDACGDAFKEKALGQSKSTFDYTPDPPDFALDIVGGNHAFLTDLWGNLGLDFESYPYLREHLQLP